MNGFANFHARPQRTVRVLATVLVLTTLATLFLLGTLQPGVEPETTGRQVPSFVLASIPGDVDRTLRPEEQMPT